MHLFALYGLILALYAIFHNISYPPTPPGSAPHTPHSPISNFFYFFIFSAIGFRQCLANLLFFVADVKRQGRRVTRQVFGVFGNVVFCGSFLLGEGIGVSSGGNDAENILFA